MLLILTRPGSGIGIAICPGSGSASGNIAAMGPSRAEADSTGRLILAASKRGTVTLGWPAARQTSEAKLATATSKADIRIAYSSPEQ
jgi:hypothetical protein